MTACIYCGSNIESSGRCESCGAPSGTGETFQVHTSTGIYIPSFEPWSSVVWVEPKPDWSGRVFIGMVFAMMVSPVVLSLLI